MEKVEVIDPGYPLLHITAGTALKMNAEINNFLLWYWLARPEDIELARRTNLEKFERLILEHRSTTALIDIVKGAVKV